MEEDIDIYADLPSITADKNNQSCNCEDIKRELNSLRSALENIQKIKENLENNMFSLLKTAKAEIMRKDNVINDLRKRLDDAAFRRNNKGESQTFSAYKQPHRTPAVAETYESVSYTHLYENENDKLNETEWRRDKYKKIKSEKSVDQVSTVFGERLHKKIIKDQIGEKMVAPLKLNPEINARETSKENIVESNKENGSQLNINNDNESNIAMKNSSSEIPYRNNLERRRMSEENNIHEYKRIRLEDDTNANGKSDYNFIVQYDLKESFAQNEMKDIPVKLEDRLDAVHSFKKEQDSFDERHRAISEHKDVKQGQSCTNGWKRRRSNSRDRDDRRRKSVDRYWSTSERSNSDYKESNYRHNSHGRSYSNSRTNHESLSGHHSRIRSSNTYRDRKYDDCKYDRRYKSERSRRDYDSRGDDETKRRSRERSNLRDASKYISSGIEDGEIVKSHKNSKYEKHRIKEAEASVSDNKRSHHSAAAGTDLQTSSSRTVVNTIVNYSDEKDADQCEAKSKSGIKSGNSMGSISANDLNNLEEGEILDSPEKTNNFEDLSNEGKVKEGKCVKMSPVEDQNEQLTSENKVINEKVSNRSNNVYGPDHLPYHQNLADSTVEIVETIEQVHDSNTYDGIIEIANNAKEGNDINSENDIQITKMDDLGIKDAADEQEEVHRPSDEDATEISEGNNFVTDSVTCKINEESSSAEIITKVKAVFHCDIESRDESEISTKRSERSTRCNTGASHLCLSDHNYNQSPANENDFDANEKPVIPSGRKTVSATIKTTEVQLEEEPVNEQSIDVKRTTSSLMKNRKDQAKGIVISRRRKAVMLSDSNASMTVLMNTDTKTSPTIGNCSDNDSVLKPRACKTSRSSVKAACK